MRVTNQMLTRNVLQNLQANLGRMQKYQHQLSSGRSVNKPSDNPLSTVRIMGLSSRLDTGEQYKKNLDGGISWLSVTETALGGVNEVMQRARELTVHGATGTLSDDSRNAIALEVEQLLGNLIQIANSTHEERYVFGGFKTVNVPFVLEEGMDGPQVNYQGDQGKIRWEVAQGVTMEMNLTGEELFVEGENLFEVLMDLKGSLLRGDTEKIGGEILENMDTAINKVLNYRAVVGARMNRLEMADKRNFEEKINMNIVQSSLYDIDLAEVLMQYSVQESVYNASLSVGARSIQLSLVDFLR